MKKMVIILSSSLFLLNTTTQTMFRNSSISRILKTTATQLRAYHEQKYPNKVIKEAYDRAVSGGSSADAFWKIGRALQELKGDSDFDKYEDLILKTHNYSLIANLNYHASEGYSAGFHILLKKTLEATLEATKK